MKKNQVENLVEYLVLTNAKQSRHSPTLRLNVLYSPMTYEAIEGLLVLAFYVDILLCLRKLNDG